MKCGSENCSRPAVARWSVTARPLTPVHGTFLLCLGHDEWYQDHDGEIRGAFRIGLLRDEQCLHTPSQREAVRLRPRPVGPPRRVGSLPPGSVTEGCGPRCQSHTGHCTACGREMSTLPSLSTRCFPCVDNGDSPHSWCPKSPQ